MRKIGSINRQLVDLKSNLLIGIKLMSTIIASESLDSVIRKAHKITKLFLTVEDQKVFRVDYATITTCLYRFTRIEELALQVECTAIKFDLKIFLKPNRETNFPAPLKKIEVMNDSGSYFELISADRFPTLNEISVQYYE